MTAKNERYSCKGKYLHTWGRALLALILLGVICFGGLLGVVLHGSYDQMEGEPETMLILGCKVMPWGGPSTLLQDRLDKALDYLEEHPDMTVIVSGGQGGDEPVTEARCMADYLTENGFPAEQILLEDQSKSTVQNLAFSKDLMEQEGVDMESGVLIVSNGFHLTRARILAERAGYGQVSTLAAPTSHMPSRIKMYIREPLALAKCILLDR